MDAAFLPLLFTSGALCLPLRKALYILNAPAAYLLPFMTDNIFVFMRSHTFGVSRRTR